MGRNSESNENVSRQVGHGGDSGSLVIGDLPKELLAHISFFLSESDVFNAAKVCRLWKEVIYSNVGLEFRDSAPIFKSIHELKLEKMRASHSLAIHREKMARAKRKFKEKIACLSGCHIIWLLK